MASWSLLEAASGFSYDAAQASLGFAPVLHPEDFRAPFVAQASWGPYAQTLEQGTFHASLQLAYGSLALSSLRLKTSRPYRSAALELEGREISALEAHAEYSLLLFSPGITIQAGESLRVILSDTP